MQTDDGRADGREKLETELVAEQSTTEAAGGGLRHGSGREGMGRSTRRGGRREYDIDRPDMAVSISSNNMAIMADVCGAGPGGLWSARGSPAHHGRTVNGQGGCGWLSPAANAQ
jgi:hypothetical protein